MLELIIIELFKLLNVRKFPSILYVNRYEYALLCREIEVNDMDVLFNLQLIIANTQRFKLK